MRRSVLIEHALDALAEAQGSDLVLEAVLVDHQERAVVRARWDGRIVYVKAERGSRRARREVAALAAAAAAGLPVPAVVRSSFGDRSVVVLDALIGSPLGPRSDDASWAAAAGVLTSVHRVDAPGGAERFDHREADWVSFFRWWVDHEAALAVAGGLLDVTAARALWYRADRVLATMSDPPRRFLHGDAQPDHVLLDEAGEVVGLIDWGDASTGDPRWDLAVLTADSPDHLGVVLAAAGQPPTDADVVRAYWIVRHLGSATWLAEHGFDPAPAVRSALALLP